MPAHLFMRAGSGVAVRYPGGWSATARNDTPVTNPALCFTVRRGESGAGAVEIKLVEYLPPELQKGVLRVQFRPRPRRFAFASLQLGDVRWTTGEIVSFREHGRAFFVGVTTAGRPDGQTRRTVEAVLDTIRVSSGRCLPTAGVGSRGGA
jgi:hypothetical protein